MRLLISRSGVRASLGALSSVFKLALRSALHAQTFLPVCAQDNARAAGPKAKETEKIAARGQKASASKGLARTAARHPTAHDDQKPGEKNTRKTAKGKEGKEIEQNPPGSQNACVSKGLARKAARRPAAHDDKKTAPKKNPKRPKSFFKVFWV